MARRQAQHEHEHDDREQRRALAETGQRAVVSNLAFVLKQADDEEGAHLERHKDDKVEQQRGQDRFRRRFCGAVKDASPRFHTPTAVNAAIM